MSEAIWHQEFVAWRSRNYVFGHSPEMVAYAEDAYRAACAAYASRLRSAEQTSRSADSDLRRALREWGLLNSRLDELEAAAIAVLRDPRAAAARDRLLSLLRDPRPISPETSPEPG